eukprot:s1727_g23.t1
MTVEKQLDAAQKFLRGIVSLASYEEARNKQAVGLQKSLEKAGPHSVLPKRQLGLVFCRLTYGGDSSRGGCAQDFTLLPHYPSDDLAGDIGNVNVDSDHLLLRVCQHAAKMSLRNASEATKATLVVLAHWVACKRGLSPKQQYELCCRCKPVVTKYLTAAPESKYLLDLPVAWQDLDPETVRRVFPTGKPAQINNLAEDVCNYVKHMPLRKDNRLLASSTQAVPATGSVPGGFLAVEDVCKVVQACSQAIQPSVDRGHSSQSLGSRQSTETLQPTRQPVLAICDIERQDVAKGGEKLDKQEPASGEPMSVEEQLWALKADMGVLPNGGDTCGAMKKPAASEAAQAAAKKRGRPPKAVMSVQKGCLKKPAAAKSSAVSKGAGVPTMETSRLRVVSYTRGFKLV